MPQTGATTGDTMKLQLGNGTGGASTTYTTVAQEITNLPSPSFSRDSKEATHLNSPEGWDEFIAGRKRGEPITIEFNYLAAHDDSFWALFGVGSGDLQILYPNEVRLQFSAIVTAFKPGDGTAETMKGSLTLQPTGKPSFLAAEED